jgi:hypothetical protein
MLIISSFNMISAAYNYTDAQPDRHLKLSEWQTGAYAVYFYSRASDAQSLFWGNISDRLCFTVQLPLLKLNPESYFLNMYPFILI